MTGVNLILGTLILVAAVYAIIRKIDVRLVLVLSALALGLVAGFGRLGAQLAGVEPVTLGQGTLTFASGPMQVLRTLLTTFSDGKFVVPICSAMGFAFVLRHTECDKHLVHLLTKPFQRVRPLLVPGTVLVAFCVNIPLISQTSTAVAVGTVMVPLLRAARIRDLTIGAALVLGSSLGGELLNRAAPELRTVAEALSAHVADADSQKCVARVLPLIWLHLLVATGLFWFLSWRADRQTPGATAIEAAVPPEFRINILKALVPFIPLVLLFLVTPALGLFSVPTDWLTDPKKLHDREMFESRLIGAAMLVGVLAAALMAPRKFKDTARAFFEGAGYGFTHIIALIVAASCFGEGIKLIGLNTLVGQLIGQFPALLIPFAAGLPLAFGTLSGSGMAATQSVFEFFVQPSLALGADPFHVGAVVSIGAAAGRTVSPVAAVTLMVANMTDTDSFAIAKRVAVPALVGLAVMVLWAMARG